MRPVEGQRHPQQARTPRMQALARLPVFFDLDGKRAVVAGNGAAVAWKAELLSAAGADVEVFAEQPCEELRALAAEAPRAPLTLRHRAWRIKDFDGAAVAVGGFEDEAAAECFAAAARTAGVPVNVIDRPAHCDFSFGAIINRSPLVIGISTDGAAPVFAQAIRAKLEGMIPRGFARWAEAARRWRQAVQSSGLSLAARRRFWQLFAAYALHHPAHEPAHGDFEVLFKNTQQQEADIGTVTLVGAGPGDPELLTLRAVRALQSADIILIDDLVSPDVLDFARREAKKMLVGKTGDGPACKQDEINALMIALAKAGRRVVRLKGGDPFVFGRGGEELEYLREAGIPVVVVPGITAALGCAAEVGLPLTFRNEAGKLAFITAQRAEDAAAIDWSGLADRDTTVVVYMGLASAAAVRDGLIAAGRDRATPSAVLARGTRADSQAAVGRLEELAALAAEVGEGPAILVIGEVAARSAPWRAAQVDAVSAREAA